MPGKFKFSLAKPEKFNQAAYLSAIHETRKLKPPPDIYVAYGPEEMGVAMVIKVQHRQEWNLVLPTDPNKYDLECGFTYGITSRRGIWDFVRPVLLGVCRSSVGAFELAWEDGDLEDVVEVGRFDHELGDIVVLHKGLPSVDQLNRAAMPRPGSGSWHSQQQ
ncbi:hypothetical protein VOLCADRAFT_103505 [Volvox carteri f. nagariensis]|uniref:Uncharacterized protein n=1 Tax=Volvox carteri f. nagariensis TaxID=3068 RepID=D8TMB3_VOLCA|nr:uncharacterized protein VOLCADRAFT_103505 [Volvox carteri f. nagariensis]EFJ51473.1 hypothetical protein VOLCADRAFT_103505 [Volvox carteri f. nagariensis]|eukprot:XP_002947425.1 hypothetical protein VOLCADRAFT_103505 [Volvox carteri f. nagariensis]